MNILKLLSPEMAHDIGKWAMKRKWFAPGEIVHEKGVMPIGIISMHNHKANDIPINILGHKVNNLLGVAAGFDKNGELVDVIKDYGFGFIEVGSVTYRGGPGNPKPRLHRGPNGELVNRMGLNGEPAELVARRLNTCKNKDYGVNIAKTHDPMIMGDDALCDFQNCWAIMKRFGFYTVVNISCPNTREGKTFEDPAALKELLSVFDDKVHPLLIKLSPWFDTKTVEACEESGIIDGYVCGNTMPSELGGVSGPRLKQFVITNLKRIITDKPVIACGGLDCAKTMTEYIEAGAIACQVYTGFVNYGPGFAKEILK